MSDGMALPFEQETLRAMQDAIPIHKAIRCEHASNATMGRLRKKSVLACCSDDCKDSAYKLSMLCVVGYNPMADTLGLVVVFLPCGCGLRKGSVH